MSKQATVDDNPAGIRWIKDCSDLKKVILVILRCIGLCFNYH